MATIAELEHAKSSHLKILKGVQALKQELEDKVKAGIGNPERIELRNGINTMLDAWHSAYDHYTDLRRNACPKNFGDYVIRDIAELHLVYAEIQMCDRMPDSLKERYDLYWGKLLMEMLDNYSILDFDVSSPVKEQVLKMIIVYKTVSQSREFNERDWERA